MLAAVKGRNTEINKSSSFFWRNTHSHGIKKTETLYGVHLADHGQLPTAIYGTYSTIKINIITR